MEGETFKTESENQYKKEWDLDRLFYNGLNDPRIKADIVKIEETVAAFVLKYEKNKKHLKSPNALLAALDDYQNSILNLSFEPIYYFHLLIKLDSNNIEAKTLLTLYGTRIDDSMKNLNFFTLEIGKITNQKKFLKGDTLKPYNYWLKTLWDKSEFKLSEKEENLLDVTNLSRRRMITSDFQKTLHSKTILHNGVKVPLDEAMKLMWEVKTEGERLSIDEAIKNARDELADLATTELNILIQDKAVTDKLRGFDQDKPYSETILRFEHDEETILTLVDSVTNRFDISKNFFKLQKDISKLDIFNKPIADGKENLLTKTFTFDESIEILRKVLGNANKEFLEIFNDMLANGQISADPMPGKSRNSTTFSSRNSEIMVLLNHRNNFSSLNVFAHEIGHAIHKKMSRKQPLIYEMYTSPVAETASRFFEGLLFEHVYEGLSDEDKIIALQHNIHAKIGNIFFQISAFNFELAAHNSHRKNGPSSKEKFISLMSKAKSDYSGLKQGESSGYQFIEFSHIREHFHVYSYAYGSLISSTLLDNYKNDGDIEKINQFLSAGGSKSPEDIFKDAGLIVDENLFNDALGKIEEEVEMLRDLFAKEIKKDIEKREELLKRQEAALAKVEK